MKKEQVKELKEYIESRVWIVWSCGRSTEYVDEFWEEGSVENLLNKLEELSKN